MKRRKSQRQKILRKHGDLSYNRRIKIDKTNFDIRKVTR